MYELGYELEIVNVSIGEFTVLYTHAETLIDTTRTDLKFPFEQVYRQTFFINI